jgi:hypothetical protein
MNNQEKPSYYAVLPANVRYDANLTPMAKLLYAEITALAQKEGHAWASNQYFATLYGVHKDTVSKWVKELIIAGYVTIDVNQAAGYLRKIYLSDLWKSADPIGKKTDPIGKNAYSYRQKRLDPIGKNADITLQENIKKNRADKNVKTKAVENSVHKERASRVTVQKVRSELARRGIVRPLPKPGSV